MHYLFVLSIFYVLLSASPGWSDGALTPAAGPQPYDRCDSKTAVCLKDEFWGGVDVTGSIGEIGWNLNGGSISACAGIVGDPGCYALSTTTSSGNVASIYTQGSANVFAPGSWDITWRVQLGQVDANTTVHIGMQDSVTTVTPTNGSYFQRLDADTNLFCVTRAAGVETRTDSGIAATTNTITLRQIRYESALVEFYINGALVCSHTNNIHSANTNAVLAIKTSTTAAKVVNVRLFSLRASVSR